MLPDGWRLYAPAYFKTAPERLLKRPLPPSYILEVDHNAAVAEVRVKFGTGDLAASGYAAETEHAFIYDRIATTLEHKQKGFGSTVTTTLSRARRNSGIPQLLVATGDGRVLNESLGWRTLFPYSIASIAKTRCLSSASRTIT